MSETEVEAPDFQYGPGQEFLTDEQRQAYLEALLNEKAGYERRLEGKPEYADRIKQVDAELDRVGKAAKPARKRAEAR